MFEQHIEEVPAKKNNAEQDYWKSQLEELQKEMKSQEVERRVLQKKNQILEEKQAKLESELQTALSMTQSQADVERLSKIVF